MISPMILVNAVYTVIDSFTSSSNVVMQYIESQSPTAYGDPITSAMSWMYFLIVILVIAAILGGAGYAVYRSKKSGRKCIGCPEGTCSGGGSHCNSCCHH